MSPFPTSCQYQAAQSQMNISASERVSPHPLARHLETPVEWRAQRSQGVIMHETITTLDTSANLRALYGPGIVPVSRGCRTCGIAGWDKALQSR